MLSPYRTALIMPETQDNGFEMVFPAFHQKKNKFQIANWLGNSATPEKFA